MLSDARIRLEGRLELLERATAIVEMAVKPFTVRSAKIALEEAGTKEIWSAEQDAREMAKAEPELAPILDRLQKARIKLADRIGDTARSRGLFGMSPRQQVDALLAEQVLYDDILRNSWSSIAPFQAACMVILGAVVALASHTVAPLLFLGTAGTAVLFLYRTRSRVVLTTGALIVDDRAIPLRDVRAVLLESTLEHRYPCAMYVHRQRLVERFTLASTPSTLIHVLRERGISVDLRGMWWH